MLQAISRLNLMRHVRTPIACLLADISLLTYKTLADAGSIRAATELLKFPDLLPMWLILQIFIFTTGETFNLCLGEIVLVFQHAVV